MRKQLKKTGKSSWFFLLAAFVFGAFFVGELAYAQDKTVEIDKIFGWTKPDAPGCAGEGAV